MKHFALILTLLLGTADAMACMGGQAEFDGGNIILTAEGATELHRGNAGPLITAQRDMLERGQTVQFRDRGVVTIGAVYVQSDPGGIIYTIYGIQRGNGPSSEIRYIKIESNYLGGGVSNRGLGFDPDFEISETFNCNGGRNGA